MSLKPLSIITIIIFLITLGLFGVLFFISKQPPKDLLKEEEAELNSVPEKTPEKEPEKELKKEKDAKSEEPKEFGENLFDAKDAVSPSDEEVEKSSLEIFVRAFIEDYGSFSSVSGYGHIEAYYPRMTRSMRDFTEIWIAGNPATQKSPSFYSIQTKVASIRFDEFDNKSATVFIETARVETDVPEYYNRPVQQNIEAKLVKDGEEWKVDGVYWK